MERLTEWYDDGEYKGVMAKEQFGNQVLKTLFEEWDEGYVGMCQLKVYEDTGLTPQEIMKLKERDTEKTPVEITAHPSYIKHFVCPRCNSGVHYMFRFCPVCGQRLKQED